jgi:TorA maturation chaperone TorD
MTMDARHHEQLSARAEFYQCLARAFLAPRDEALAQAMRDALADDVGELAAEIGYAIDAPLAHYREQIGWVAGPAALLQIYSSLFLAPPVPARINAGMYLDGAMNGGSVKAMEEAYLACGVERDERFRDLADHVTVQLEFVAMLYAAQAAMFAGEADGEPPPVDPGEFLHAFARRWVGPLCADLTRATRERELDANPYLPLARILEAAVACDAVAPEVDAKAARKRHAIEIARAKVAARGISADDLAEIKRKLEARGLATEHLDVPPEERDAAMGLGKKRLPGQH